MIFLLTKPSLVLKIMLLQEKNKTLRNYWIMKTISKIEIIYSANKNLSLIISKFYFFVVESKLEMKLCINIVYNEMVWFWQYNKIWYQIVVTAYRLIRKT